MKEKIEINIELDDNMIPEAIDWSASQTDIKNEQAKSLLLSFWDYKSNNTLTMNMWTKEMTIEEMNYFLYQTLISIGENFQKATNDTRTFEELKKFCEAFAVIKNIKNIAK